MSLGWRGAFSEALRRAGWAPALVFTAHVVAVNVFRGYERFPPLDIPMHLLGGAAIAFFFDNGYRAARSRELLGQPARGLVFVLIFALSTSAAVFWEFAEFLSDRFFGTRTQLSLEDTLLDMLLGCVGSVLYLWISSRGESIETGLVARPGAGRPRMSLEIRNAVPMAFVKEVARSIGFYERLGFRVAHTFCPPGAADPSWACLDAGRASLMLARASDPVQSESQSVLFYLYYDDVPAAKSALTQAGVETGPIEHPFYAPRGEFRVVDPDGYVLMVTHT